MSFPPAPQLAAALEVLYRALIDARMLGYERQQGGLSSTKCDQLAALMDAVHEIPRLLADWERCDESLLRGILEDYDKRWTCGLLATYDRTLADNQSDKNSGR